MPINKATIMTRGTTLGHVSISSILCWFSVVEEFANNAVVIMLMHIVIC